MGPENKKINVVLPKAEYDEEELQELAKKEGVELDPKESKGEEILKNLPDLAA